MPNAGKSFDPVLSSGGQRMVRGVPFRSWIPDGDFPVRRDLKRVNGDRFPREQASLDFDDRLGC